MWELAVCPPAFVWGIKRRWSPALVGPSCPGIPPVCALLFAGVHSRVHEPLPAGVQLPVEGQADGVHPHGHPEGAHVQRQAPEKLARYLPAHGVCSLSKAEVLKEIEKWFLLCCWVCLLWRGSFVISLSWLQCISGKTNWVRLESHGRRSLVACSPWGR